MNRRVAALAFAIVLSLFAAACGGGESAAPLITTTTIEGAGERTGVMWLVEPVFEQVECPGNIARDDLACGLVELLVDADDATTGTTIISIATLAGSENDQPAVAVAHGGPGASSTDLAGWFPRQRYTQVFIDQRGTGFALADFDCPEYDAALPFLLEAPAADLLRIEADALADCAARIGGVGAFDATETGAHADDVQTVMLGLGHVDEWYFYGVSYGSTIGLDLLAEPRPALAGVILDGVYPRSLDLDADVTTSAQAAADAIAAACAADADCSQLTDDFAADLDSAVVELDRSPMLVTVPADQSGFGRELNVRLDGTRLADLTFVLMYSERNIAGLPAAIARIRDGDQAAAAWLTAAGSRTLASAYGANDEGTYFAVQCHDRTPLADGLEPLGRPFADAIVTVPLAAACEAWDREPAEVDELIGALEAGVPTLLLSGEFDPITPPAYADAIAAQLEIATVVTQAGRSHGIWSGSDCIQEIVAAFVVSGGSAPDTSCAAEPVPVDWFDPS